jgi:hypothetical protein
MEGEMDSAYNMHGGGEWNTYKIWVEKSEEKGPLGRPRRRCEDNIKMNLIEIGWNGMGRIHLVENRNPEYGLCEHGNEP